MPHRRTGRPRQAIGTAVVAVLSAATWFAWMGWDQQYQVDAAGVTSGPYEAWQVAGCALTLIALFAGAARAGVRLPLVSAALTVGFTVAWTAQAARDETGLFAVGAVLVLTGLAAATALASGAVLWLRGVRTR